MAVKFSCSLEFAPVRWLLLLLLVLSSKDKKSRAARKRVAEVGIVRKVGQPFGDLGTPKRIEGQQKNKLTGIGI